MAPFVIGSRVLNEAQAEASAASFAGFCALYLLYVVSPLARAEGF